MNKKLLRLELNNIDDTTITAFEKILLESARNKFGFDISFSNNSRAIIISLIRNKIRYGRMFCPCRTERTIKTICPCDYAKEELLEKGKCYCGLFEINREHKQQNNKLD